MVDVFTYNQRDHEFEPMRLTARDGFRIVGHAYRDAAITILGTVASARNVGVVSTRALINGCGIVERAFRTAVKSTCTSCHKAAQGLPMRVLAVAACTGLSAVASGIVVGGATGVSMHTLFPEHGGAHWWNDFYFSQREALKYSLVAYKVGLYSAMPVAFFLSSRAVFAPEYSKSVEVAPISNVGQHLPTKSTRRVIARGGNARRVAAASAAFVGMFLS